MRSIISVAAVIVAFVLGSATAHAAQVLAHFPFDLDFSDASGNGHDGVPTNAAEVSITATNAKFGGGAANFAKTVTPTPNDYVSLSTSPIHFDTGTAYALAFWARPTDSTGNNDGGMIMGDPSNTTSFVWVEEAAGGLRLRSATNINANTALTGFKDGNFHHFVVQVLALDGDGINNDVQVYYDNVAKTPVKNVSNTSLDIKAIGQGYTTGLNVVYKGQIDEVWIFNGNLSSGEVADLYNSNTVPEPSTLLGIAALALLRRHRGVGGTKIVRS